MGAPRRVSPLTIAIRAATPDDIAEMAAIEQQCFSDPWPPSGFEELMRQPYALMMVATGKAAAVCGYCVLLHGGGEGEIANLAVAPKFRRRGVAAALLDDGLGTANTLGLLSVYLEVRVSNESARGLYASRGFAPVGRRRAYYREPLEDALVLRRDTQENERPGANLMQGIS